MKHAREEAATRQWIQRELNYVTLHEPRHGDDWRSARAPHAAFESAVSPVAQSPDLPTPEQ
jgi:hypothetical protein